MVPHPLRKVEELLPVHILRPHLHNSGCQDRRTFCLKVWKIFLCFRPNRYLEQSDPRAISDRADGGTRIPGLGVRLQDEA